MSWIKLSDQLPPVGEEVYLCIEGENDQNVKEGYLEHFSNFMRDIFPEEYMFNGNGWFRMRLINDFTHWHPKIKPLHVSFEENKNN